MFTIDNFIRESLQDKYHGHGVVDKVYELSRILNDHKNTWTKNMSEIFDSYNKDIGAIRYEHSNLTIDLIVESLNHYTALNARQWQVILSFFNHNLIVNNSSENISRMKKSIVSFNLYWLQVFSDLFMDLVNLFKFGVLDLRNILVAQEPIIDTFNYDFNGMSSLEYLVYVKQNISNFHNHSNKYWVSKNILKIGDGKDVFIPKVWLDESDSPQQNIQWKKMFFEYYEHYSSNRDFCSFILDTLGPEDTISEIMTSSLFSPQLKFKALKILNKL